MEFAQHREYVPGDDIRHVDWKVFARTDKVHLKQYEDETNLCCWLAVDQSSSMQFKSESASLSKAEYAASIAVTIAWLILNQRDAVGLALFSNELQEIIRPSDQREHLTHLVDRLAASANHEGAQATNLQQSLTAIAREATKRGVVIVVTDGFDEFAALARGLETLRQRRHHVVLLQVLDPAETTLEYALPMKLKSMESDWSASIDPIALKKAYTEVLEESRLEMMTFCRNQKIDFHRATTDKNIATVIRQLMMQQ